MALLRYPGSKAKLFKQIRDHFPDQMLYELSSNMTQMEYREPFFGSGEFGLRVLPRIDFRCPVWINDIDPGVAALWTAVYKAPAKLCRLVGAFKPTTDAFYEFKERDGQLTGNPAVDGFRKLALHRMSFSGFGAKAGGPLGGRKQSSAYNVQCRWTASTITREVMEISKVMRRFNSLTITCADFSALVENAPENCFIYLDPPYYKKGAQLYKYNMLHDCHERLALMLRDCAAEWLVSYDDHPTIRDLYPGAVVHHISATYSNAVCKTEKRPKNQEVVIKRGAREMEHVA